MNFVIKHHKKDGVNVYVLVDAAGQQIEWIKGGPNLGDCRPNHVTIIGSFQLLRRIMPRHDMMIYQFKSDEFYLEEKIEIDFMGR